MNRFVFSTKCQPLIYLVQCYNGVLKHSVLHRERRSGQLKKLSLPRSLSFARVLKPYQFKYSSARRCERTQFSTRMLCEFCSHIEIHTSQTAGKN